MSTWQRYTNAVALQRMEEGQCPECGLDPSVHGGLGGPYCGLTDTGVAGRIWQYEQDKKAEVAS